MKMETEVCDLLLRELEDRFEQRQLLPPILFLSLENILLKAANGEPYEEYCQMAKMSGYKDDINFDHLQKQLPLCADLIRQALPGVIQVTSMHTICEAMNTQQVYKSMLCEVHNLLR